MVYWTTNSITSSMRLYYEEFHRENVLEKSRELYVATPTGAAVFPREIAKVPLDWLRCFYNVTWFKWMDRGGHFAALEEPELLVDAIRGFVHGLVHTPSSSSSGEKKNEL
jgi:hypothetical protein